MVTLLDRRRSQAPKHSQRFSFQDLVNWYQISGGGGLFPAGLRQTMVGSDAEGIPANLEGLTAGALQANSIIWTLEMLRMAIFSEVRFAFQRLRSGRPNGLFSAPGIDRLRHPWPNGTSGDLLTAMILDADMAGNAFIAVDGSELVRLRPDWVTIMLEPRQIGRTNRGETGTVGKRLTGYAYTEGGIGSDNDPVIFMPDEVAHFAPFPDPAASFRGMSWLTPCIREIRADNQATDHKSAFWRNAATPNGMVKFDPAVVKTQEQMDEWIEAFEGFNVGPQHSGKTLYMGAGADFEVIGNDFKQMDYKAVVGAGETRLAAAAGLHAAFVGLSEGMEGSSLNAGNYTVIRRKVADTTFAPLWRNVCGSLETIVRPPSDAELWFDSRDVAFLRDDEEKEAKIFTQKAAGMRQLFDAGWNPDAIVQAAETMDLSLLTHDGRPSVQVQPDEPAPDSGDDDDDD